METLQELERRELKLREDLLHRQAARFSFEQYCTYVDPRYQVIATQGARNIHRDLIEILEDVEKGIIKRLRISCPARLGKTRLGGINFPSWYLGRHPDKSFVLASYSANMAVKFSKDTRRMAMSDRYKSVFPNFQMANDQGAKGDWETIQGGGMYAVGVEGGLTGRGGNVLYIDDPVKDMKDAQSPVVQEATVDRYESVLSTRKQDENSAIVLTMCMVGSTRVLMEDRSWKEIKNIKEGDVVLSYKNGQLTTGIVRHHINQGVDNVFRLKTNNHTVVANARHPFLCEDGEYRKLSDLKPGDKIYCLGKIDGGEKKYDLDTLWALGYMFGDGWITHCKNKKGSKYWLVCVSKKNKEERNKKILGILGKLAGGREFTETKYGYYRIYSSDLGRYLESLGFEGKAHTKRIPEYIYGLDIESRQAFLDGFLGADGYVRKSNGRIETRLCNYDLVNDIKLLSTSLGYKVSNITSQTREYQPPNSPKPIIASNHAISYSPVNKSENIFELATVKSIVPVESEEVFDLTVEGEENFIAEGLVVHNTRWDLHDLAGYLENKEKEGGDRFVKFTIKAIDENDHPIIWPGKRGPTYFFKEREIRSHKVWTALYQQDPTDMSGALFKPGEERYFLESDFEKEGGILKKSDFNLGLIVDPAFSSNIKSDDIVLMMVGQHKLTKDIYVFDIWAETKAPTVSRRQMFFMLKKWIMNGFNKPFVSIEQVDINKDQTAFYKNRCKDMEDLSEFYTTYQYRPKVDKAQRIVDEIEPMWTANKVYFNKNIPQEVLKETMDQIFKFPNVKHDDRIDCLAQAIAQFHKLKLIDPREENRARNKKEDIMYDPVTNEVISGQR